MHPEFIDLKATEHDLQVLEDFYREVYIPGFPDPDERESLDNMRKYLSLKARGWYGKNNYHIVFLRRDGHIVGGSVSDYLVNANVGVIEFILVDETARGHGYARLLHDETLRIFDVDARKSTGSPLAASIIELNDPYRVPAERDNMDPFKRALMWGRWGYGRLDFRYIQPALSSEQQPAESLILAARSIYPRLDRMSALKVRDAVAGYLRWAMRIERPEEDPTFRRMARALAMQETVAIEPLERYIGYDPALPVDFRETGPGHPNFEETICLFERSFPAGPTAINARDFGRAGARVAPLTAHYHLWALAESPEAPVAGLASFFVMHRFGFGGYIALQSPLRGTGRAAVVIKRMEAQMLRDAPKVTEWFVECAPGSPEESIFKRLGFQLVAVDYRQPPLQTSGNTNTKPGPKLSLLVKPLGAPNRSLPMRSRKILSRIAEILRVVYGIQDPNDSDTYRLAAQSLCSDDRLGKQGMNDE